MGKYTRSIEELEANAVHWWPEDLKDRVAEDSPIETLASTQDAFLEILKNPINAPERILENIKASHLPSNLFLKHLAVAVDYGGEPIQRLGRSFGDIFDVEETGQFVMEYFWGNAAHKYVFQGLPVRGLSNSKLSIDGPGLSTNRPLDPLISDLIMILLFGALSTASDQADLGKCDLGSLIGDSDALDAHVRQLYLYVSKITSGATSNSRGQLAEKIVSDKLIELLPHSFNVRSGGIPVKGYNKASGIPFDIIVESHNSKVGIEVSFQVTTNSVIERKSGQASLRLDLMHSAGYFIAYVIDGEGNFQRKSAVSTICDYSDCTVAFSEPEFLVLAAFVKEKLG